MAQTHERSPEGRSPERDPPKAGRVEGVKYEEALKRLEKLVADLEHPDVDLETRLKKFEEGTKLARLLLKKLDQAKKHVERLVRTQAGEAALVPFDEDAGEDESSDASPSA